MEKEVEQLVEMGASLSQARAALRQYKDVMEAAEKIFEGKFDNLLDETEQARANTQNGNGELNKPTGMVTPDDEDDDLEEEDDDSVIDYVDYDSDYEAKPEAGRGIPDIDPYAGIFFSKDRREEVIEIEEDLETLVIPGTGKAVKVMSQGQWMKGCPEGGEQSFLFSLYDQLSTGTCACSDCGLPYHRGKSDFFALYPEFGEYIERLRGLVRHTCFKCSAQFCLACGEPASKERVQRPNAATDDNPLFHCSNLQGVILGVGLSMLENHFIEQSQDTHISSVAVSDKVSKKRKVQDVSAEDMDEDEDIYYGTSTGRGKKSKGGVGYAGNVKEDTSGHTEAMEIQRNKDEKMASLLSAIRIYLPSLQRPGGGQTSDYLVHPTTLAHLRRRFNFVGSALLRNDSLTDMSDRSVLYFELFEWLETISNHEALASMMAMPIMVPVTVKSVITRKPSSSSRAIRERTVIYEGSSGPRELLEAIVIQSQAAVKGLEGGRLTVEVTEEDMTEEEKRMTVEERGKGKQKENQQSPENTRLLQFCHRILATAKAIDRSLRDTKGDAFVERLHASLPKIYTSTEVARPELSVNSSDEDVRKTYVSWATKARFEYCDLTIAPSVSLKSSAKVTRDEDLAPNYKFYYNTEARLLANADIPKRSLAIAKELAVLTTNLPVAWDSSVFLRVDESRVDIIKCLITGPEGTPYHNGCYLFDIFLGPSYNQTPPSVKYMTTGGGKFRFNPNLYADGKVCLSLLGTWTGPGWIPGKSTLLQVLISIQSMILCEEPYLNEPGWANSTGTPQSMAYSANVRRMVVNTAMLGMLKNPPEPFEEVIHTHFRLKARPIKEQLDRWLTQDDGRPTAGDGGGYTPPPKKDDANETGGSQSSFSKDVAELKELLTMLEKEGGTVKAGASMEVDG